MLPRTNRFANTGVAKSDAPHELRRHKPLQHPWALLALILSFAVTAADIQAAERGAAKPVAGISDGRADDLYMASDVMPPMPMPHPKRASSLRRAAYSQMLKTWPGSRATATPSRNGQSFSASQQDRRASDSDTIKGELSAPASNPAVSQFNRARDVAKLPNPPTAKPNSDGAAPAASRASLQPAPPAMRNGEQSPDISPTNTDSKNTEPPVPETWSADEIAAAEQLCENLLGGVAAEVDRLDPLRSGSCGTPKPVLLRRIGSGEGLALEPPATTNCAITARLYQWFETVAQPAAKNAFGSRIVKVRNASAYMCRNRYNDPAQKISEHAFANALDISAFELADGRTVDVKRYWGLVVESEEAQRVAQAARTPTQLGAAEKTSIKPSGLGVRAVTAGISQTKAEAKPRRAEPSTNQTAELTFLRELHAGACGIFSTVLGPEANRAHHDHFHFDLKGRRGAAYCE